MNDMTPGLGHNNPPDPIEEALAPYMDAIEEAENWLDGEPITNEAQLAEVSALTEEVRAAKTATTKAQKAATAPLYAAYKEEGDRWKPTIEDLGRRLDGLKAIAELFRKKLDEEKEAAKRAAYEEARRKELEAQEAAAKASAADYESQLAADLAKKEAMEAKKAASAANRDQVKGLKTVTKYEIEAHARALRDIADNDRDAITAFVEEYVRRNHRVRAIDGVRVWTEKVAR